MVSYHLMPRWVQTAVFICFSSFSLAGSVTVDTSRHETSNRFKVAVTGERLIIDWMGSQDVPLRMAFNLDDPERLISELSIAARLILKDAAPAYWVYVGQRHGSWEDNYFDNPSTRPHEISSYSGKLIPEKCSVEDDGSRLAVKFNGFRMGVFYGDIVFTLYAGSNLVKQEAVVATEEPNVAFYYDASLTRCSTNQLNRLLWLSADDRFETYRLVSDIDLEGPHLKVHRRTLIAEGQGGSLAVFPPASVFLCPG